MQRKIGFGLMLLLALGIGYGAYAADAYIENFTTGAPGTQPPGWFDATDGVGPAAQIVIASVPAATGYADVTVTNSGGWGNVTNGTQTIDVTAFPNLDVVITQLQAATVVITLFDATGVPVGHRLNPVSIGAPGTYTFNIPALTGLSGTTPIFLQLTVEAANGNWAKFHQIRIYSATTPTFTPTFTPTPTMTASASVTPTRTVSASSTVSPTSTATPNAAFSSTFTPTISATATITPTATPSRTNSPTFTATATATTGASTFAFFDDFLTGAPGTQPPNWFDASDGIAPPAQIIISSTPATTSFADITVTSAAGFGNVTSVTQTINVTQFPFLNVVITSLQSSTVVITLFDATGVPVGHRLNPVSIGAPGTYTFNIPALTGLSGALPVFIQLTVESNQGNWAKFDLVDISSVAAATPTFTPTPVITTPSNAFFDDFTNGLPPVLPLGWRDDTTDPTVGANPGFGATLQRLGTTFAVMAKNNSPTGFGKVLSPQQTTDFDAFQELEVSITAMDPNTEFILGIQDANTATGYVSLGGIITAPGIYTRNIRAASNSLAGLHTYNVDLRIQNFNNNSVTLDFVRVGLTSTPTITPTSTATPVPNTFRPSANLFLPKQGALKLNYAVQQPSHFRVTVFNLAGQVVRSLKNEDVKGTISGVLEWDGKNDNGAAVASGVYLIRLETDVFRQNIRVAVVK